MKSFWIVLIVLCALCAALFALWFLVTRAKARCPFCAMKKVFVPRRVTIDTTRFAPYTAPQDKPVMGWSSWNTFHRNIDEDLILETAQAMKASGLADAGYEYINIDDCWQSSLRDIHGRLQGDFPRFPSGIPALIGRINALGLKAGLYTSNGNLTCEDLPASLGREETDAATLAEWGAEFFKYDFCHNHLESGIAPPIECIEFSKIGEKPFAVITPEDVRYTGLARTIRDKKLASGKAMGFLSYGAGKAHFSVNAPEAGSYVLTICYHKRKVLKPPYLLVDIGGNLFEVLFPKARAFTPAGRTQTMIELQQGENHIEISNPIVNRSDGAFLQYARMGRALQKAAEGKKPIVFSICEWGYNRPYLWGEKAGNMWRTTPDIRPKWNSVRWIYGHNIKLWRYASPGHFNDPDMLEVGNGELTEEENRAHFALWCMMAAPLVLGNDIRKFLKPDGTPDSDNKTLQIVTNKALIAIDGDPLAKPAKRVKRGGVDVLARPLAGGDLAVCFLNKTGSAKKAHFALAELQTDPYFAAPSSSDWTATELWSGESSEGNTLTATVPRHGVKVYRLTPKH